MSGTPVTATAIDWAAIQRRALLISAGGAVICVIGALLSWQHFLRGWLVAWTFWNGISLGALALLMIQYITGGAWGLLLRRIFEAAASNIALMAVLFLVLLLGLPAVYEWANPAAVAESPVLQHKQTYLNQHAFMIRAAIYFILWTMMAWLLKSWSQKQDRIGASARARRPLPHAQRSRLGDLRRHRNVRFDRLGDVPRTRMVLHHFSAVVCGRANYFPLWHFQLPCFMSLADHPPFVHILTSQQRRDLGNLLLAFVMLWAYLSFSQFMIIWSENLP